MAKIRAIIFDEAGVVLNIDPEKTKQAFIALGAPKLVVNELFDKDKIIDDYDRGEISTTDLRKELRKKLHIPHATDLQINNAFCAELTQVSQEHLKETLEYIKQQKDKGYKTFLLTNMNELEYYAIIEILEEKNCTSLFQQCFDRQYYSFLTRVIKPHKEAYLQITQENDLAADETFFIDDRKRNVEGAEAAGLYAIQLEGRLIDFDIPAYIDKLDNNTSLTAANETSDTSAIPRVTL